MRRVMRIFYGLILGVYSLLGFAQEPLYTWGEPVTNADLDLPVFKLLGADENGIDLIRSTKDLYNKTYFIEHISPQLKLEYTQQLKFSVGVMGNSHYIVGFERIANADYALVEHWNKALGSKSLSIEKIVGNELEFAAIVGEISAEKQGRSGFFSWAISPDNSKLLVFSNLPVDKKTPEKKRYQVFNTQNFQSLYNVDFTLTEVTSKGIYNTPLVDNNGNAYLYKRSYVKPNYIYTLYAVNAKSKELSTHILPLQDKNVVDYKFAFNQSEVWFLATYATDKVVSFGTQVNGYIAYAFNTSDASLNQNVFEPWNEIVYRKVGKSASKPGETIGAFKIKDVLFNSKNQPILLLEEHTQTKSMITGSSPMQYEYRNKFGAILAIALDEETAKPLWSQTVFKEQETISTTETDKFGSFIYYIKNDRIFVIYNNTQLTKPSIPPSNWKEPDGTKYVKKDAFGDKTIHASFLEIIEPNGARAFRDRTFGLPLFNMHRDAVFPMSLVTNFFVPYGDGVMLKAEMHNGGKRYRYGLLSY